MKYKKILASITTFAVAITAAATPFISTLPLPTVEQEASAETYGDYNYTVLDDGTVSITEYTGTDTEIIIPSAIDSKSVTSIGNSAFSSCSSLTSITIPNSVTSIENYAFMRCSSLTSINVSKDNENYCSVDGVLFNKDKTEIICYPAGKSDKSYAIPGSVTSIEDYAFYYCSSLESVTIPDGVMSTGDYAFSMCSSLESITIPNSVTSIGYSAFSSCKSLTSITIPDSATNIGEWAFIGCSSLTSISIPDGVTSIGGNTFFLCKSLESITIPNSVTSIDSAFFGCSSLTDVYYTGTEAQWNAIDIESYNEDLLNATIHYNCNSAPSAPTGLNLKGRAADALRIAWTKVADADGYIVEMYKNGQWVRAAKITANSTTEFKKSGLSADTAYKFRVKSYKMSSKTALYSDYVNISARTNPSKVTGLKLKGRANNALRISWNKNANADGYIVEMYKDGKWVRVAKIAKNSTVEWKQTGLAAGTAYKFRVKAYKMNGKTAVYSSYVNISARTNPSNVTGMKTLGRAKTAVRFGWKKNTSADGYIVEMYKGGKWVRAAKITKNSTVQFKKTGLKAGTTYKFRIRAYKMSGKTALYSGYTNFNISTTK